jgi:cold shock CspA family protein
LETGRILQFDHGRGYGFVAADDGGEDIFLHASVFDGDTDELHPGMRVGFKTMAGDRGRKAFAARLIDDEPEYKDPGLPPRRIPPPPPVVLSQPVPAPPAPVPAPPVPVLPAAQTLSPAPVPQGPDEEHEADEEPMCDVLSPDEFGQELTELLLDNASSLTGQQIRQVRQGVLALAGKHGWLDN